MYFLKKNSQTKYLLPIYFPNIVLQHVGNYNMKKFLFEYKTLKTIIFK